MPETAKAPLYEGASVRRVLITGIDRMDHEDPAIYTFVGTIGGKVAGVEERRVEIYIDATPNAIVDGLIHIFVGAADLVVMALKRRLRALGAAHEAKSEEARPDTRH